MTEAVNQEIGKLVDLGPDQRTPASKKWPVKTSSPATGLERVPPKRERMVEVG